MRWLLILLGLVFLCSCVTEKPTAESVLQNCLQAHGYQNFLNSQIDFDFRGKHYTLMRNGGDFRYIRRFRDSTGVVTDILDNSGFQRLLSGEAHSLEQQEEKRLKNSLNSVAYFALLPFPLKDPAVNIRLLGETNIANERFFELEVTFREEGGGDDFEDRFVYWIRKKDYILTHFAYRFHVNGGGTRFRKAVYSRIENGVLLSDYRNYRSKTEMADIADYEEAFADSQVKHVSDIKLENLVISVKQPVYISSGF